MKVTTQFLVLLAGGLAAFSSEFASADPASAEIAQDPYAACVAAETSGAIGNLLAEAKARQKCRKLFPAKSVTSPASRAPASGNVNLDGPSVSVSSAPSTPTVAGGSSATGSPSAAGSGSPSIPSAPTPPSVPAVGGGNPHGGPPGLNK